MRLRSMIGAATTAWVALVLAFLVVVGGLAGTASASTSLADSASARTARHAATTPPADPAVPPGSAPVSQSERGYDHARVMARGDSSAAFSGPFSGSYATSAPGGRTVISGHGSYSPSSGAARMPEGTSVTTYTPHGSSITDDLGNAIETGSSNRIVYSETFGPGSRIPDYTVHPPGDLNIVGSPVTVSKPTQLSELLKPGMGECHLAICLSQPGHPLSEAWMGALG